jgi:hypothetical protein
MAASIAYYHRASELLQSVLARDAGVPRQRRRRGAHRGRCRLQVGTETIIAVLIFSTLYVSAVCVDDGFH